MDITHAEMVRTLVKSGEEIKEQMTPEQANLWHLATGISGEAGELLDAVKKHAIYQKPLDFENMKEELGDLEFYMEGVRQAIGVTRAEIVEMNMDKLGKRYPGYVYTNAAAINRADKIEESEAIRLLNTEPHPEFDFSEHDIEEPDEQTN